MKSLLVKIFLVLTISILALLGRDELSYKSVWDIFFIGIVVILFLLTVWRDYLIQKNEQNQSNNLISLDAKNRQQLEEIGRLQDIGRTQLKATFYIGELERPIENIHVLLLLKKKIEFSNFHPYMIAIDLYTYANKKLRFKRLIKSAELAHKGTEQSKIPIESYELSSLEQDTGKTLNTGKLIHGKTKMEHILIPLSIQENSGFVKDLHDEKVFFYFSKNILEVIDRFQFIINGWVVVDGKAENIDWDPFPMSRLVTWESCELGEHEMMRVYPNPSDGKSSSFEGYIDLFSGIPFRHDSLKSKYGN
jgi:hypothetical protein